MRQLTAVVALLFFCSAGNAQNLTERRMSSADIGTVVFPDAVVKAYLDASDAERARRRHGDEEVAQRSVAVEDLRVEMARRDRLDSSRGASPLHAAADAMKELTGGMDIPGLGSMFS